MTEGKLSQWNLLATIPSSAAQLPNERTAKRCSINRLFFNFNPPWWFIGFCTKLNCIFPGLHIFHAIHPLGSVKTCWAIHTKPMQKPVMLIVPGPEIRMQEKVIFGELRKTEFGRKVPKYQQRLSSDQPTDDSISTLPRRKGWRREAVLEKWAWRKMRKMPERTSPERHNSSSGTFQDPPCPSNK